MESAIRINSSHVGLEVPMTEDTVIRGAQQREKGKNKNYSQSL